MIQIVIRLSLTAVLMIAVYIETGWATALTFTLAAIANELNQLRLNNIHRAVMSLQTVQAGQTQDGVNKEELAYYKISAAIASAVYGKKDQP